MGSFAKRALPHTLPEHMDDETDAEVLTACLKSLASVNTLSFGRAPSIAFARRAAARRRREDPLTLLDMGSGYGDTVRAIGAALSRDGVPAELIGADLNPIATDAARSATGEIDGVAIRFETRDARDVRPSSGAVDAIQSSLFMHHLEDDEIVAFLRWMDGASRIGWFINDLYRSRFAAVGFGALATASRRHPYVRHDGPVSFARSFRAQDWRRLLDRAGIEGARLFIGAPFRLCVEKLHVPALG